MHDSMPKPDLAPIDPTWVTWRERFAWHVGAVPDLIGEILRHRDPTKAARYDRELVSGSGADGTPAPLNVGVLDDADGLWSGVVAFAEMVESWFHSEAAEVPGPALEREARGVVGVSFVDPMPHMSTAKRGGIVIGVHPLLDEYQAVVQADRLVAWLLRWAGEIRKRPVLVAAATEIEPTIRSLRKRYGIERRRAGAVMKRECTTCGAVAVVVEWAMSVSEVRGSARCLECRQQYGMDI